MVSDAMWMPAAIARRHTMRHHDPRENPYAYCTTGTALRQVSDVGIWALRQAAAWSPVGVDGHKTCAKGRLPDLAARASLMGERA